MTEPPDLSGTVQRILDDGETLAEIELDQIAGIIGAVNVETGEEIPVETLSAFDRERAREDAWENWRRNK
jgi:hypothetical protein